jgi:hypothetical protein
MLHAPTLQWCKQMQNKVTARHCSEEEEKSDRHVPGNHIVMGFATVCIINVSHSFI